MMIEAAILDRHESAGQIGRKLLDGDVRACHFAAPLIGRQLAALRMALHRLAHRPRGLVRPRDPPDPAPDRKDAALREGYCARNGSVQPATAPAGARFAALAPGSCSGAKRP